MEAVSPEPLRLAVLASGGGSNLQALLDRFPSAGVSPARVELVVASRDGIGALRRARDRGVPARVLDRGGSAPEQHARDLLATLKEHSVDLVVLAGYLQLVPAPVVRRYAGRILNVHPALLPCFGGAGMYGIRVHRAVIESGARISGATVHEVDERYDTGRILAQWPVPVLPGDSAESLAARVLRVEHRLLPAVVEAIATGAPPPSPEEGCFEWAPGSAPSPESLRRALVLPRV